MNSTTDNEIIGTLESTMTVAFPGSLRDWFAGQALAGILSDSQSMTAAARAAVKNDETTDEYMTRTCYEIAAAMLKAREE